jgi:hypothetical protein
MPDTFYGKWSLEVIGNVGEFDQRMRIVGSIASDGIVAGTIGTTVPQIDGAGWNVFMERSADGGVTWQTNLVQRIPSVVPPVGLIVTLYGDDDIVPPLDSDITVRFVYLNPQVNPPGVPPYNYTLPPGQFRPKRPPKVCPCCCQCECKCMRPVRKPRSPCAKTRRR